MGFPVLRTLSLYEQTPGVNWQPIAHVFAQAPLLNWIGLDMNGSPWLKDFDIPWSQIRYLQCSGLHDTTNFFKILRLMPNIVHCKDAVVFNEYHPLPPIPHIRLEYLTHLNLMCWEDRAFGYIIPTLELPALEELYLIHVYSTDLVKDLLARSNCALQIHTLALDLTVGLRGEAFCDLLATTPNLVDFRIMIEDKFEGDKVLSEIFLPPLTSGETIDAHPVKAPLPRLAKFEATVYNTTREAVEGLLRILPSILPSLESVEIFIRATDHATTDTCHWKRE